jgi:hypothetical protein
VCVRARARVCVCVCVFVCVCVGLVIQHARRRRRTVMSSVACLALQDFSTISQKWNNFRKNVLKHEVCLFRFALQILSEMFLILRRIQGDIIINVHRSSRKVLIILVNFNET